MQKVRNKEGTVDYYRTLASLAISENESRISNFLDSRAKSKMFSYLPRSLEIWDKAIFDFANVERIIGSSYKLNEERKAYAIDSIALSKAFGLQSERLEFAYKAFAIYYLSVHLLDDLMEDPKKFYSKFIYSEEEGKERRIRASGASFIYTADLTVHNILEKHSKLDPADMLRTESLMDESLAKMIKYFRIKNQALSPEKIIDVKNRKVSGEATSFFLEFANLEKSQRNRINQHIRDSAVYLGSLTQFTDDLRDLEEDRRDKNINLFIGLRGLHGKDASLEWARLYHNEEQNMVRSIEKSNIDADINLLKTIPWYPFFAKEQLKRLMRK